MKLYIIPYLKTDNPSILEVRGLETNFFEKEIEGDFHMDMVQITTENLSDTIIQLREFISPVSFEPDPLIAEYMKNMQFDIEPEFQELGVLIHLNVVPFLYKDVLGGHEWIFPNEDTFKYNGLIEMTD